MDGDAALREELVNLLTKRQAHMDLAEAVADFPAEEINMRVPNGEYTFWQLLEHMRITQKDILDYTEAETYTWLDWPDGYWPARAATTDAAGWAETIAQFEADRQRLVDIVLDPGVDLFAPLANSGERGHTIVREIHVVASHNSYHTGELGILRGVMGYWK
jgi:uncharacterized damage-inducible protein DinB